jgi:hypothetical protein
VASSQVPCPEQVTLAHGPVKDTHDVPWARYPASQLQLAVPPFAEQSPCPEQVTPAHGPVMFDDELPHAARVNAQAKRKRMVRSSNKRRT